MAPASGEAFDVIVVGAGSGGCAVTRQLVDHGLKVLLLEAGPSGNGTAELADPVLWPALSGGRFDWRLRYAPHPATGERTIPIPRGKVLGGSAEINAMLWYRGHRADYDDWAAGGSPGWSFAECLSAFCAAEDWRGAPSDLRGDGGPLTITEPADPHPLAIGLMEAAAESGVPMVADLNGPEDEGAALANLNIADGRRCGAALGYLSPILRAPNLTVRTEAQALSLTFDGARARGVAYRQDGKVTSAIAAHGVVLAAGAFETPRLLMLSGIGPESELRRLGLPERLHSPGVGANLQDHPLLCAFNFVAKQPLGPVRDNGGGAVINWRTALATDRADAHAFIVQGRSATPEVAGAYGLERCAEPVFAIGAGLMGSRSKGFVQLTGADPDAPLHIAPGFLTDPHDVAALIEAARFVLQLVERPALSAWFKAHLAPGTSHERADLEAFVRRATSTFYHPVGTARMGTGPGSVVDPSLRVHGIEGLWIADASVMPRIPSCNTHAPVTMIGERAATFVLASL